MSQQTLISQLEERGLLALVSDREALEAQLSEGMVTLYCGFDPTADSLHIGHLVPLLTLKRFQLAGHRPVALVGGATGMIGDPSFKAAERKLNTPDITAGWSERIRQQVSPFLDFDRGANSAVVSNNFNWFGNMNVLDFLRDIGKHFSVNAMINKDSVKQRIDRDEAGISFTEFAYSLLQGYDFVELNRQLQCKLQIGGSDQWGNIASGIDLTRRMNREQVFGLTLPLITKSDGTKFGKTESGAVWLDPKKTSPYKFYQFWLGAADADVYRFLAFYTFLPMSEIQEIEAADKAREGAPQAQRLLAEQVTALVHGAAAVEAAQRISQCLFSEDQQSLTEDDFGQLALDGLPTVTLKLGEQNLIDTLVAGGLAASKSQARGFIESGAVALNGAKVSELAYVPQASDQRFGRYTLLRRGKKNHCLVVWG
ncbi:tyrosine--tRNA ligase [Paludibacterium purpuratum]|uniref:Tyrosine--tRNA ligase n=1 Tax=Paludibacterium purpuratum TaxID=1144873 RepID=A0A4R7B3J1_9NEIS|nr:tyrosine--tRNA ligase [Paludibacterium purpuratum]TDR78378.1 tyrosyl-tRNA synthetase [Paludibacterium purpuratum]